jgi:phospholipid/cholesterol/gamma-HCH transport system substrate-binding protein
MEPKVNYTLVGLFIALLGAAALTGVLWLSRTDYRGVYDRYYTFMDESVSGLSRDSYVKYQGVEVGRVKEIALDPNNPEQVRLGLDLVRGTPVKEDTVAVLETQGLTGITIVNLRGGSRASPLLSAKPGERYPIIKSEPSFYAQLSGSLARLTTNEQIPALLANLTNLTQDARSLLDAQSRADLKRTLAALAQVTQTLALHRSELAGAVAQSEAAADRFAAVGKKLDEKLPELFEQASANLRGLERMTDQLARAGATLNSTVDGSRGEIAQFTGQTLAEAGLLIGEMRQLTATLQKVSSDLEREPSTLIFGRAPPVRGPGE